MCRILHTESNYWLINQAVLEDAAASHVRQRGAPPHPRTTKIQAEILLEKKEIFVPKIHHSMLKRSMEKALN